MNPSFSEPVLHLLDFALTDWECVLLDLSFTSPFFVFCLGYVHEAEYFILNFPASSFPKVPLKVCHQFIEYRLYRVRVSGVHMSGKISFAPVIGPQESGEMTLLANMKLWVLTKFEVFINVGEVGVHV